MSSICSVCGEPSTCITKECDFCDGCICIRCVGNMRPDMPDSYRVWSQCDRCKKAVCRNCMRICCTCLSNDELGACPSAYCAECEPQMTKVCADHDWWMCPTHSSEGKECGQCGACSYCHVKCDSISKCDICDDGLICDECEDAVRASEIDPWVMPRCHSCKRLVCRWCIYAFVCNTPCFSLENTLFCIECKDKASAKIAQRTEDHS
jgi:hypothetical protein